MKIWTLITLVATATIAPLEVSVQPAANANAQQTEDMRVVAAEDEYVAAEVNRDEATLRLLVDDSFLFNTSQGTTTGKEALIQSVLKMNMVGQTITERSVLIEGNIALVFDTAELRFADPGRPETRSTLRYTATYVNRQGQRGLLALQMQERA